LGGGGTLGNARFRRRKTGQRPGRRRGRTLGFESKKKKEKFKTVWQKKENTQPS